MGKVTTELSMSLDGFVAGLDDEVGSLFDWYFHGDVEVPTADPRLVFHTSEASARHIRDGWARVGCLVSGRRLFDYTKGWGGRHPVGAPVVVVTHGRLPRTWIGEHPGAPFTFVTEGVEAAIETASGIAGERNVSVAGPNVIQQCFDLGLMDEICIDLVPVLLGGGIPFFGRLAKPPVRLHGPRVVEGEGVTHLYYTVKKDGEAGA